MNNVFNCYFFLSWKFSGLHKQYYNLSLGGTPNSMQKGSILLSVIVFLFSTSQVLSSSKSSGVSTWAIHGCIPLSAAGSHRSWGWARTGASLRQHCSRYLAAVTADYPLNSPLSANRKSSIISFLHSWVSFRGHFPSGQCLRFPTLHLLRYSPYTFVSGTVLPAAALKSEPQLSALRIPSCWMKFQCCPTGPGFCATEKETPDSCCYCLGIRHPEWWKGLFLPHDSVFTSKNPTSGK